MEDNATKNEVNSSQEPLLPRSAWNNQIAFLRVVFRAKKALDLVENEAELFHLQ